MIWNSVFYGISYYSTFLLNMFVTLAVMHLLNSIIDLDINLDEIQTTSWHFRIFRMRHKEKMLPEPY